MESARASLSGGPVPITSEEMIVLQRGVGLDDDVTLYVVAGGTVETRSLGIAGLPCHVLPDGTTGLLVQTSRSLRALVTAAADLLERRAAAGGLD
jgi:hypothetical protein